MRSSKTVIWLSWLIVVLASVATLGGMLWRGGPGPYTVTSLRGQSVQMYGQGLYRYDSLLIGAGYRGNDAVTLIVGVPLLVAGLRLHQRGSLRGGLLLTAMIAYFVYSYASMSFGAAYNELFLVYVAIFSASLFAFVLAFTAIDLPALAVRFAERLPRRGVAVYLFVSAAVLVIVWLGLSLLPFILVGQPPTILETYTTLMTHVLDLGIVTPVLVLSGMLLLRSAAAGYLLSAIMVVLGTVLGLSISAASASQLLSGVPFTPGQIVGLIIPFVILTLGGLWSWITLFRNMQKPIERAHRQPPPSARTSARHAAARR